jgi:drug/metabolite transporter (DMT)-like permease
MILLASVLFGIMAVLVRLASREMSGAEVAFFRFAGSLLVLLAVTRGRGLKPGAGNLGPLVLRGAIGSAAIVLYFVGIRGAGAGLATLLQNTYPVFASIFAALVLGERFPGRLGLALGLSVAGIGLVVGPDLRIGSAATGGALAACASAVLSGAAVVAARHLRRTENASLITFYFMGVGAVVTAPALLAGPPLSAPPVLALLGVVVTSVAGQWLLHHGLGFSTAARASLVAATSVVTAAALEAALLGQTPSRHALAGACLMVAAIGLAAERS